MEGYYWRLAHPDAGWVIVCLCGVCRGSGGSWATVALAAHPDGFLRHATLEPAAGDRDGFGARAGGAFRGSLDRLRVRMADDAWIEARLRPRVMWPRPRAAFKIGMTALTVGYLGMALLGPLTLDSASPWVLTLGHLACLAVLWRLAVGVKPTDADSFGGSYMRVWALFFVEYLLVPTAVLAAV